MQDDVEQRRMYFHYAVVIDEAKFSKFIHKMTHAGACGAYDFRKCRLTDLGQYKVRGILFTVMPSEEESAPVVSHWS